MSLFPEIDEEIKDIKQAEKEKIQELKDKSERYVPSSFEEGDRFEDRLCGTCGKDNPSEEIYCPFLGELFMGGCDEIIKYRNKIMCLKHSDFSIKSYMKVEL